MTKPESHADGTINGLYKAKLIHRRAPWKRREAVELATLERGSWFNSHRLLEPIGHVPPAETKAAYYRQLAESATTGRPKPTSLRSFWGASGDFA